MLEGHIPFIALSLFVPLGVELVLVVFHAYSVLRRGIVQEPYGTAYTIALLVIVAGVLGVDIILYKSAYDSTYLRATPGGPMGGGIVVTSWRFIVSPEDLALYQAIVEALTPFYALAGVALGLALLPLLMRRVHSLWYIETPALAAGPLMFAYLEARPLMDMKFSLGMLRLLELQLGATPWNVLARGNLLPALAAGLAGGILVSFLTLYLVRRFSRNYQALARLSERVKPELPY